MKKLTCKKCKKETLHFTAHALGKCSHCGADIKFCDFCDLAIPPGGDGFKGSYNRGIKTMGGEKYTDTLNILKYKVERLKAKLTRKKAAG